MVRRAPIILPISGANPFSAPSDYVNVYSTDFDGINQYVNFGTIADIQFDRLDPFSFAFWSKFPAVASTTHILGNWTSSLGWRARLQATGEMSFQFTGSTGNLAIETTATYDDDTWRHFAITYDGTSSAAGATIYVNGSSVGTTTLSDTLSAGGTNTQNLIAGATGTPSQYYTGNLDEIAIFDDELTSGEITTLYNGGTVKDLTGSTHIIHWWKMGDGDTFPTILDQIGSLNGSMVNMAAGNFVMDVP